MKTKWKDGYYQPPNENGAPVLAYLQNRSEFRVMNYWNDPDDCEPGRCPTFIDPEANVEEYPNDVKWCELPEKP